MDYPLVTGLLVFDRPRQAAAARYSIDSFFSQKWPSKELIVFNATSCSILPRRKHRSGFKELRLKAPTIQHALHLCVANANGEWLANWMPDCWYHPDYLSTLMQQRDKTQPVVLRHKQICSLVHKSFSIISSDAVSCWCCYRHHGELCFDDPFSAQFPAVKYLDNPAHLVVKFVREIL